jgi:hypothetical protein
MAKLLFDLAGKELAANVIGHNQRYWMLLHFLGAATFLCIEMILTRLTRDKLAWFGDADALGV